MDFSTALLCVVFTTFGACYAWGMRGAVIGGEKGAMLPGAFIGLALALFSGGTISEHFWIPTAAAAMGMTYGGTEPYGETIGMVLHRDRPIKGYTGLAMKGAFWFSVCGGFIGISFASMSGSIYKTSDLIVFCLLIPVIQIIGYNIFNMPYDKQKGVYPKIFYSYTRREEWGSNLALIIAMMAMAIIRGDDFTLAMMGSGFFFGGLGWLVAMKSYVLSVNPLKKGKYIFGKLYRNGLIDGWKIMEFVLGAFGGFGLSLAFCTQYKYIEKYNAIINTEGIRLPDEIFGKIMPFIISACILGVLAINIYQFICDKKNKKVDCFFWDRIERPLYNVIPMLLVLLGSVFTAKIMTVFILVFVCGMKCAFDRFADAKLLPLGQTVISAICIAVFAGCFYDVYSPFAVIVAGTVPYLIAELASVLWRNSEKCISIRKTLTGTAFGTVYPCFVIQSVIILSVFCKIFGI